MRRIGVFLLSLLMVFSMVGCGKKETDKKVEKEETTKKEETVKYTSSVHITINPELRLYLDKDQQVVDVVFLNDDAKEAFSDIDFSEISLEEAMSSVIIASADAGYLTEGKDINIEVEHTEKSVKENEAKKILQTAEKAVQKTAEEKKLDVNLQTSVVAVKEIPSAEEAIKEAEKKTKQEPAKDPCEACDGTGVCPECSGGTLPCKRCGGTLVEACANCDSSGQQVCQGCKGSGTDATSGAACGYCGGSGRYRCEVCGGVHNKNCTICNGKGVVSDDCILCHGGKKCTVCGGTGTKK